LDWLPPCAARDTVFNPGEMEELSRYTPSIMMRGWLNPLREVIPRRRNDSLTRWSGIGRNVAPLIYHSARHPAFVIGNLHEFTEIPKPPSWQVVLLTKWPGHNSLFRLVTFPPWHVNFVLLDDACFHWAVSDEWKYQ
jgi:hypothetical protein